MVRFHRANADMPRRIITAHESQDKLERIRRTIFPKG